MHISKRSSIFRSVAAYLEAFQHISKRSSISRSVSAYLEAFQHISKTSSISRSVPSYQKAFQHISKLVSISRSVPASETFLSVFDVTASGSARSSDLLSSSRSRQPLICSHIYHNVVMNNSVNSSSLGGTISCSSDAADEFISVNCYIDLKSYVA